MTTDELRAKFEALPCPFCGGIPVDHLKIHGRCIECQGCGASGPELPLGGYARDMERLWNHRANFSRDAEVEALKRDAEIGRYVLKYAEWIRDEDETLMAIRFAGHVDCLGVISIHGHTKAHRIRRGMSKAAARTRVRLSKANSSTRRKYSPDRYRDTDRNFSTLFPSVSSSL